MTVSELIAELQKQPNDAEVSIIVTNINTSYNPNDVGIVALGDNIKVSTSHPVGNVAIISPECNYPNNMRC